MRALLIDPSKNIDEMITETQIETWRDIVPAIGGECRFFDVLNIDQDNTLYVDDEGLVNGATESVGLFALRDYPQPLAGRGIIQGIDRTTGDSVSTTMTIDEAQKHIGIITPIGIPIFRA